MSTSSTSTVNERRLYILLSAVVWLIIAVRAHLIPWVNDEALTFLLYVEPRDYLPGIAAWDANNHFLNSALMSAAYEILDLSHLGSRLGNVLAFGAFAWAVFQLGAHLHSALVRWCLWLALLFCPLLFELFTLARGYGMGIAFWLAATVWMMRLAGAWSLRALLWSLALLLLANAAVMAALPVWAVTLVALAFLFARHAQAAERWLSALAWILLGAAPLIGAIWYSMELRARGGYFIGSLDGFVPVSVATLMKELIGTDDTAVAWTVSLLVAVAMVLVVWKHRRDRVLLIPVALLGVDVLSRIGMAWLLEVNYPIDRAVAHLIPWASFVLAVALDRASMRRPAVAFIAIVLLTLPARTLLTFNGQRSVLFPTQGPAESLVRRIADEQAGGPTLLGGPRHMSMPLALEARRLGLEAPRLDGDIPLSPWFEHRITWGRPDADAALGYVIIDSAATGHFLLKREQPLVLVAEWEGSAPPTEGPTEYIVLLQGDTLTTAVDRIIDIDGPMNSDGEPIALNLVVAANGSDGSGLYYESYLIHLLRPRWNGERLRLRVPVPAIANAVERRIYIWNIERRPLRTGPFKVSLRTLGE